MKTYERISQLEKLGVEVEEYKIHLAKKWLKNSDLLAKFDDGGEEYELERRKWVIQLPKQGIYLPRYSINVSNQAKDRDVYLNILRLEGIDIDKLEGKTIRCSGHVVRKPEVFYYFRLPMSDFVRIRI